MAIHQLEIDDHNEKILADVVRISNKNTGRNFTKDQYLSWLLNNWFGNKEKEMRHNYEEVSNRTRNQVGSNISEKEVQAS